MKPGQAEQSDRALAAITVAVFLMGSIVRAQDALPPPPPRQDGGPVIIGERDEEFESLVIKRVRAVFEYIYRHRTDERKQPGKPTARDTEDTMRPSFQVTTEGYIIHPNVVEFSLTGRFRIEDQKLDSQTLDLNEDTLTFDTEYNIRTLILQRSATPINVYSRRSETSIDRLFGSSFDSILTEHGGGVRFINDKAPTSIQYFHRDEEQIDARGILDFGLKQDTFDLQSGIALAQNQTLDVDYTMDIISQTGSTQVTADFIRHDATLLHEWKFGEAAQHELRSRLRWYEQVGDFGFRRIGLDETLRFKHSDHLRTQYDLFYENLSRDDSIQDYLRGNFNVSHRLYESLVTSANIGGSMLDVDGFTSNEYFGDVTLDYIKKVPYGVLNASASISGNLQENGSRGQPLRILDSPRTFNDPSPIILARRNIFASTIVITDLGGIIFYVEGVDYTLRSFPDRVEIRRIVGGRIVNGQTVLIDYTIGPEPANSITSTNIGLNLRYDVNEGPFNGLGTYLRYFQRDASIDSLVPSAFVLDQSSDLILGADYTRGPWTLVTEYEKFDSTISPFDSTRFDIRYVHRTARGSSLSISGAYQMIDFPSIENHIDLGVISAQWTQRINNQWRIGARIDWRDQRDDLDGQSQGFEQQLDLYWRHRQTEVYLTGRNSIFNSHNEDRLRQSLEVGFRRNF